MYIQPLGPAIHPQDLQFHGYAEDTQLLVPGLISGHHQAHTTVDSVKAGCLPTKNKDHEPEVIPPASANKLSAILYCFCFLWSFFFFSPAYWESWCLSLMHQSHESDINAVCKPTFLELCKVSHIWPFLSVFTKKKLTSAYVLSSGLLLFSTFQSS